MDLMAFTLMPTLDARAKLGPMMNIMRKNYQLRQKCMENHQESVSDGSLLLSRVSISLPRYPTVNKTFFH
jgi:hypothetical protein